MFTYKFLFYLVTLINCMVSLNISPNSWKRVIVVSLLKRGDDIHAPSSYHSIYLLSCLSIIFEHDLVNRLKEFYNSHDLYIPEKFGFRAGHSTQYQFRRVTELIHDGHSKGNVMEIILLDVQKAFGKIWHVAIIYKVFKDGVPTQLVRLMLTISFSVLSFLEY